MDQRLNKQQTNIENMETFITTKFTEGHNKMEQLLGQIINLNQSHNAPIPSHYNHHAGMTSLIQTPPPYMGHHLHIATPSIAMYGPHNSQPLMSLKNVSPGSQNQQTTGDSNHQQSLDTENGIAM
eukprot:2279214-Ditylum_brightwellii.AAC.1